MKMDAKSDLSGISLDTFFKQYVGTFGRFQKLLTVYMWLIVGPLISFNMAGQLLILLIPFHSCDYRRAYNISLHLGLNESVLTEDHFIGKTSEGKYESCSMFKYSETGVDFNQTMDCDNGWVYKHDVVYPTVVSENNWVCADASKTLFSHTIYWSGSVIGILVMGALADRLGRVKTSMICFTLTGVAGLCTIPAASNYTAFLVVRAIMGSVTFKGIVPSVLVTEFVGVRSRLLVSTGFVLSIAFVNGALPWVAYWMSDWRLLVGLTSGAMFLVPIISIFTPESVRWLASNGRIAEAKDVLRKVGRINGRPVSDSDLNRIVFSSNKAVPIIHIFHYKRFLKLFIITCFVWFSVSMAYIGGNIHAAHLASNPYIFLSVYGALDVAAALASQWLAGRFGRKKAIIINSVLACILFISTYFISPEDTGVYYPVIFIARFAVTVMFNVNFMYGAELFPTVIRSRALSVRVSLGSIGNLISPAVVSATVFGENTPLIIFGLASGIAGVFMIFLPETLGQPLPETLADGDNFGLQITREDGKDNVAFSPETEQTKF